MITTLFLRLSAWNRNQRGRSHFEQGGTRLPRVSSIVRPTALHRTALRPTHRERGRAGQLTTPGHKGNHKPLNNSCCPSDSVPPQPVIIAPTVRNGPARSGGRGR